MIITVGAEKGGVGKTRLATHIATLAAMDGADCLLLDTDRQGSAISWSRIRNEDPNLPTIPVLPIPPNPARELTSLSEKYDLIVVDIGAQNYRAMLEAALLSDLVLVPTGADQQEVESLLNVFATLRQYDDRHLRGTIPAWAVLTRVSTTPGAKATTDLREFLQSEHIPVLSAHLAHREAWRHSGKTGRCVHELRGPDRSAKAAAEIQAVYDEIKSVIQKGAK